MTGTHEGKRLQEAAYRFYVGWGTLALVIVVLMIEGSILGAIAFHPLMRWLLAALGILVVVMWCISVVASFRCRDTRLAILWGGTVVYAAVVGFVPFWATLVYGVACCAIAARWLTEMRSTKTEHVPWT